VTPAPIGGSASLLCPDTKTRNALSEFSNGTVFDNQMWSANFGVLP
jgi:hypothetical protein